MKICVIGGSGFVGSRLISLLKDESVINIDKNNSPFFNDITTIGDIRNLDEIDLSPDIDCVVLLAAEHRDDVSPTSLYYDVNVEGTKNVLKAMDKFNIKNLIFTSSVAVYGLNKPNPGEDFPTDPFNHYGKSKLLAEEEIKKWFESNPLNKSVTIIRPTVIFGERNRGNVYNLLKQISTGRFVMVGKGTNKKSMAYVGNVVAFIYNRILSKKNGLETYNYIDKPDFTMNDLLDQVSKSLNKKIPILRLPYFLGILIGYSFDFLAWVMRKKLSVSSVRIKKFCATTQFNSEKMLKEFTPPFTLTKGLDATLKHEFIDKKSDDIVFYSE